MTDPLTPEEEAEVRARDASVPWTAALGTGEWTHEAAWQAVDDRRRLLATLDAERGDRERQFREWKAAQDISVAEWQRQIDAARTASVAGLDGASMIAAERRRQIKSERYDADHDAGHADELALAAAAYAIPPDQRVRAPRLWPWAARYWKPKDRVRDLVRAGALIAAAIDAEQGSAPSIEQEPGDLAAVLHKNGIGCLEADVDGVPRDADDDRRTHEHDAATIRAALREQEPGEHICANHDESLDEAYRKGVADGQASLREQEPGETLRAAAEAALALIQGDRETRQGGAVDIVHRSGPTHWDDRRHIARCRTCNVEAALRAALEADRNPQETERRVLVCTMNESSASAHGHTDACYETVRNPQ